ncbi:MAG: OmpA family protein [Bernardetiaceae bacterium]
MILRLLCLCLVGVSLPAQDFTGHWRGELTQETGGVKELYQFELMIVHRSDSIVGKSRIANISNPTVQGELSFRATWTPPLLRLLEYEILPSLLTINPPNFCIKKAKLTYDPKGDALEGPWEGVSPVYGMCAPGYLRVRRISESLPDDLRPPAPPMTDKTVVFSGERIREGASIQLPNINFAPTSAKLTDTTTLQTLVGFLQQYPNVAIELSGHTDRNPEKDHPGYDRIRTMHQELSEQRLAAVLEYLQKKGIPTTRIQTRAYGGERPLSLENSANNRRVEMKILKID